MTVRRRWAGMALMAAMIVGCGDVERSDRMEQTSGEAALPNVQLPPPRAAANIFYSGHSLMDRPLPDFVRSIAESLAYANQWNRQYVVGSSLKRRTHGAAPSGAQWQGLQEGYNREGEGLDILAEWRAPRTIDGRYEILLVTEEHTMMEKVVSGDTVRYLQEYHDRFIDSNPSGSTYFYEPWFSVENKADPSRWIEYETAASSVWQCVVTRINLSLEAQGRTDRLISLPAGAALAELVKRAVIEADMPSISQAAALDTMNSIFRDDVHLTPLGFYYAALVTFSSVYRQSPQGAWFPEHLSAEQAAELQELAWQFVSGYYANYRPLTLAQCRNGPLSDAGQAVLWSYIRDAYWRKDVGALRSHARYLRRLFESRRLMRTDGPENPMYFDTVTAHHESSRAR